MSHPGYRDHIRLSIYSTESIFAGILSKNMKNYSMGNNSVGWGAHALAA